MKILKRWIYRWQYVFYIVQLYCITILFGLINEKNYSFMLTRTEQQNIDPLAVSIDAQKAYL